METIEILGAIMFGLAVGHTFLAGRFKALGNKYPEGSIPENVFHLLGETEVVFGLWGGILFLTMMFVNGVGAAVKYAEGRNYTEPLFVFVIMTMAATRPVLTAATKIIELVGRLIPVKPAVGFYLAALFVGPLLGSLITEPAAMTIVALLLGERYYKRRVSRRFMYSTLAVLFVNVSIAGSLTSFAAPPVLMVAGKWGWNTSFMLTHFGWKAALACAVNAFGVTAFNRADLRRLAEEPTVSSQGQASMASPLWIIMVHLFFLGIVVAAAHHPVIFMGAFLFFLGVATVTQEYQDPLKMKEGMLVGFFLAGLVFLGGLQSWWLGPIITSLSSGKLFLGATCLTAVTDNAALTYLGATVEGITDPSKYALVAGALAGGGLTVIANAPNPAGFGLLKGHFEGGNKEFSSLALFLAALLPTIIVMIAFWVL